jgi:Ricin-type beta-trefoil lectin domain/Concanavalin A-like lectin/glucanases superfamily
VWSTAVNSSNPSDWFTRAADITPAGGSFSLTLQPGHVYSLTTTAGQGKGTAASPSQGTLPLPYSDNFDGATAGQQPRYLAQQQGAFEAGPCAGGRSGQCVAQQAAVRPIEWDGNSSPYTIGGNLGWGNYAVSADVLLQQPGAVQIMGRVGTQASFAPANFNAYYFQVSNTGAWSIVRNTTGGATTLASGTTTALGTGTWHHLSFTLNGSSISGAVDGTTVGSVTDSTFAAGMIGLGVSGYQTDQFDNLSVTQNGPPTTTGPIVAGVNSAKCVDDNAQSTANGTKIQLWDCNSGANQQWTIASDGTIRVLGKCMDITGAGTANGTLVELWDCNGGANQQWKASNGTLVNPVSGRCLDDPGSSTANGTQLDIWDCNGGANQHWTLP